MLSMENAGATLQIIAINPEQQVLKELVRLRLRQVMHVLRHSPETYGLQLDEGRWAQMNELHRVLRMTHFRRWKDVSLGDLFTFVRTIGDRLQLKRGKVRATYGHAKGKAPNYEPAVPPETLLHGTSLDLIPEIRQHGLDGKDRAYVHLTTSFSYASSISHMHKLNGTIVEILSGEAVASGFPFFRATSTIWLSPPLPPQFVRAYSKNGIQAFGNESAS